MSFVTNKPRNIHELKILPNYFQAVAFRLKRFEVRKNGRNFRSGDLVVLKEYDTEKGYTGNEAIVEITYVLNDENYCKQGYVIFSIELLKVYCKKAEKPMIYRNMEEVIDSEI